MTHLPRQSAEFRVLVLAPTGKDGALTQALLERAGVACVCCGDLRETCEQMEQGVGALLLAEEAILDGQKACLEEWLEKQSTWSDLPVLVLARPGADSAAVAQAMDLLGNVTVLERPIRVAALVSAVRTALRARERQYDAREQLVQLEQSESDLRDFFENANVGLHWVGPDGIILRANQTELQLLGYSRDEYIGRHIAEFHVDVEVIQDILEKLTRGETICEREARLKCKDGSIRHVLINSTVLWQDGKFVRTRCLTLDITARKEAEEALRAADRRKDEFLAILAHELRNPLAPIRNSLHILRLSQQDAGTTRVTEMMERQVNHMVRLVDDLMEVSRITRGKIELRTEDVEVAAIVRGAVETSRPLIDAGGHELTISLPAEPLTLQGDLVRLTQVIANLLNNAAKYTDPGGQIQLAARREGNQVAISVRDSGVGIQPEMLATAFEMFTQIDRDANRTQGGLGIGLTLVKRLVEMHGGSVQASSGGKGLGSEFIVRLPLAERSGDRSRSSIAGSDLRVPKRVLVVDDNRDAAESLGMLLDLLGAEVRVVFDGPSALELLPNYKPAVVLLDLGMPGMDGLEVARRIRQQPEFADVKLIALTGWGQPEDRSRSQSAGFDYHLIKPADVRALENLLVSLGDERTA